MGGTENRLEKAASTALSYYQSHLEHSGAESKSTSKAYWSSHLTACSVLTRKNKRFHNHKAAMTEQITIFLKNYMQSN
jgi:hypothetical protein